MSFTFNIASGPDGPQSISVFGASRPMVATPAHPAWTEILAAATSGASLEDVEALFDRANAVAAVFQRLGQRVTARHGRLYLDGDVLTGPLAEMILRAVENLDTVLAARLVAFLEKAATNPNPGSIEHLYRWARQHDFEIAPDGDLIGYKGVSKGTNAEGRPTYLSVYAGSAIVDGVEVEGNIPTAPGSIVEMPRSAVTFDPHQGCSAGLHVGTFPYAQGYGNVCLRVKVNPRDVVSVPNDSTAKMRVCRYEILGEITERPSAGISAFDPAPAAEYRRTWDADAQGEEDEDDFCAACGEPGDINDDDLCEDCAQVICAWCEDSFAADSAYATEDDNVFCSRNCLDEWIEENTEDEDEEEEEPTGFLF